MDNKLFDLIKNTKFDDLYELLKTIKTQNDIIDLNIKDSNHNYFIQYIILYNQYNILKLIFDLLELNLITIRLDILDNDGRTILFNCIKYNYNNLINILISYNKISVGISILDIKDIFGYSSLFYCIQFNNYDIFKLLIENNANPYIYTHDKNNGFTLCIIHKRLEMLKYLIEKKFNLDFLSDQNKNILQIVLEYYDNEIINYLLDNLRSPGALFKIDLNNRINDTGLTILHQTIILNYIDLFKKIIEFELDINLSDYLGNTSLHYIILERRYEFLDSILKFNNLNFNCVNINGDTPLHIILKYKLYEKIEINMFIKNTNLNILNNEGNSCFMLIINSSSLTESLIDKYKYILIEKPLNISINEDINKKINKGLLQILVESYYNQIKLNQDKLLYNWEKKCCNEKYDIKKCKKKIEEIIINKKKTLPKFLNNNLKIDKGIVVTNQSFYTGNPIDILFGLILLYNTFKNKGLDIILEYPLTMNNLLNEHYKKIGIEYSHILNFSNIEILWSFQKIFYPSYFDNLIDKKMKTAKYIIIPIGIETSLGAHANILFWDVTNKTIERFEPNGGIYPFNFNYNPVLLDTLLEKKFLNFDNNIKYYTPSSFLPIIGFQFLENIETEKYRKIGDPDGFCAVWCIWWIYQRMLNINSKIDIVNIANEIIKIIKLDKLNFKAIIRNFSKKISNIRDKYLKKYNLDINDWVVENYDLNIIHKLEKDILNIL